MTVLHGDIAVLFIVVQVYMYSPFYSAFVTHASEPGLFPSSAPSSQSSTH